MSLRRFCEASDVLAGTLEVVSRQPRPPGRGAVGLGKRCRGLFGADQPAARRRAKTRSEEHTSELQSRLHLVCRLLLEKKKKPVMLHISPHDLCPYEVCPTHDATRLAH